MPFGGALAELGMMRKFTLHVVDPHQSARPKYIRFDRALPLLIKVRARQHAMPCTAVDGNEDLITECGACEGGPRFL
jgi:hypothetical protein